jgi:glycosyltransferase involved in cell wall biosynthesis
MQIALVANLKPGFVPPDFKAPGVGGSEASAILLCEELAALGHQVEVFNPTDREGTFQGVRYAPVSKFNPGSPCDVLVVFRAAHPALAHAQARRRVFWSTDVMRGDWDTTVFPFVDHVLSMSGFHRDVLFATHQRIPKDRTSILGLGVVKEAYFGADPQPLPEKAGNRLIYCSVPDRGLIHLARLFPRIKEQVPDAELLVTSDYSLWGLEPGNEGYKQLLAATPGVRFLGRVNRQTLVACQKSAKIMAYPCTYHEGFCLAALECMAAGAVPVTTDDFALKTTVADSGILIPGRPGEAAYDEQFVRSVVRLLREEGVRADLAARGRQRVLADHTWEAVAKRFEAIVATIEPRSGVAHAAHMEQRTDHSPPPSQASPCLPHEPTSPFSLQPSAFLTTVCVVIPVFNQGHYLVRALSSVVWQLGPQDEVIVVDDASTEPASALTSLPFRDRVLWLRNPIRQGVSHSRNMAILRSRAEWIKFLDADDMLAPFALDLVRQARHPVPDHVMVLGGGCHRIVNGRYHDYLCDSATSLQRIKEINPLLPSSVVVRRAALVEVGLFDERIDYEEDWDLWLRLHDRFGLACFSATTVPVCYYWIDSRERAQKQRQATVDGVPVREYFRRRYGANPGPPATPPGGPPAEEAAILSQALRPDPEQQRRGQDTLAGERVSCLMVTTNRLEFVERSVRCFQEQSYKDLELVVVSASTDGTDEYLAGLGDARIKVVHLGRAMPLGTMRNVAVSTATGQFVTQWDDDDWFHPDRVRLQMEALKSNGAEACLLERLTLAWPDKGLFCHSKRRPWENSILALRSRLPAYEAIPIGEDYRCVQEMIQRRVRLCLLDEPRLYVYVAHGRNTCSSDHFSMNIFNEHTGQLDAAQAADVLGNLGLKQPRTG